MAHAIGYFKKSLVNLEFTTCWEYAGDKQYSEGVPGTQRG
jgi:hypothetical protein